MSRPHVVAFVRARLANMRKPHARGGERVPWTLASGKRVKVARVGVDGSPEEPVIVGHLVRGTTAMWFLADDPDVTYLPLHLEPGVYAPEDVWLGIWNEGGQPIGSCMVFTENVAFLPGTLASVPLQCIRVTAG